MLPIDLSELFLDEIKAGKRPNDGLLHASMDLTGSLRHTQLRIAGAPTNDREIASEIRLQHGTLWHEWFHDTLEKHHVPFFHEVRLDDHMPEGWSGTADWVFWHPDYKAFVLGDLKTSRGEAMFWINKDGAKKEHIWQLSAYYYALLDMGLPMVKGFAIMYWPMNDTSDKEVILPSVQECEPIPKEELYLEMNSRQEKTHIYIKSLVTNSNIIYINKHLAPVLEREQKLYWSKVSKAFEVKLVPHWLSQFCPYSDELCDCSQQGTTKIGEYKFTLGDLRSDITTGELPDSWEYEARKGYEGVRPEVEPSNADKIKRQKELDA